MNIPFLHSGAQDLSFVTAAAPQILSTYIGADSEGEPISGLMPNNGSISSTITTQNGAFTISPGYTSGGTVTASLTPSTLDTSIITGSAIETTTGSKNYDWKTVVSIPSGYHDAQTLTTTYDTIFPTPSNAGSAANVLTEKQFYDKDGKLITGTMTNNNAVSATVGLNSSYPIPSGYHNGSGKVYNKWQYFSSSTTNTSNRTVWSCWSSSLNIVCNTISMASNFTPVYLNFFCADTSTNGNHGGYINFTNGTVFHSVSGSYGEYPLTTANWRGGQTLYLPTNDSNTIVYYLLIGYYS